MGSEMNEDYVRAKTAVGRAVPAIKYVLALFLLIVLGVPLLIWGFGVLVLAWPLVIVVGIVLAIGLIAGRGRQRSKEAEIRAVVVARQNLPLDTPQTNRWIIRSVSGNYSAESLDELKIFATQRRVGRADLVFDPTTARWTVAADVDDLVEPFRTARGD
jgi:hypothetical protein